MADDDLIMDDNDDFEGVEEWSKSQGLEEDLRIAYGKCAQQEEIAKRYKKDYDKVSDVTYEFMEAAHDVLQAFDKMMKALSTTTIQFDRANNPFEKLRATLNRTREFMDAPVDATDDWEDDLDFHQYAEELKDLSVGEVTQRYNKRTQDIIKGVAADVHGIPMGSEAVVMELLENVDNDITKQSREGASKQKLMEHCIPYILAFPNEYELGSSNIDGQILYETTEDTVAGLMWKDEEPESNEEVAMDDNWDDADDVPF